MNKNKLVLLSGFIVVALITLGLGTYVMADDAEMATTQQQVAIDKDVMEKPDHYGENFEDEIVIKSKDGARHEFSIELSTTPAQHAQGLMYRKSMPAMHGMLFVFGSNMQRSFWMKNTFIPLDIIFLEQDGRIQHIHSMAKPQDEAHISSPGESFAVLEINGGMAAKLGLAAGDYVHHSAFKNKHLE